MSIEMTESYNPKEDDMPILKLSSESARFIAENTVGRKYQAYLDPKEMREYIYDAEDGRRLSIFEVQERLEAMRQLSLNLIEDSQNTISMNHVQTNKNAQVYVNIESVNIKFEKDNRIMQIGDSLDLQLNIEPAHVTSPKMLTIRFSIKDIKT